MKNYKTIFTSSLYEHTSKSVKSFTFTRLISMLLLGFSTLSLAQITRTQIISNALPYTVLSWTATSANLWNGLSCGNKTVTTPAWVSIGSNTSMPYCWGGFTSTTTFQGYLNAGKSAGDNNTVTNFGAEPSCAVGLDCSGFVSRAWGLSSKQSTSSIPNISTPLSLIQTQPGDVVNLAGSHVRLIETNYGNGNYRVIESSGADWKTAYHSYTANSLSSYTPRYYNNVSGGGGSIPGSFSLALVPECSTTTSQIRLNWTKSSGSASYDIYRNNNLFASGVVDTQFINLGNLMVDSSYTYYVKAKNLTGSANSNSQSAIALNCSPNLCTAVAIIIQPENQTANVGSTATFGISTSGTGPFSYFWYKTGVLLKSTINSLSISNYYTTPPLTTIGIGDYYCIITNCNGTNQVQSDNAYLEVTVDIENEFSVKPKFYKLSQNFPNPFNPSTLIRYDLPVGGQVLIKVYDVFGREVSTLVAEYKSAGSHYTEFNARNLTSGTYFCRLSAGNFSEIKKLIFIK